jgi:hypothetical protein
LDHKSGRRDITHDLSDEEADRVFERAKERRKKSFLSGR